MLKINQPVWIQVVSSDEEERQKSLKSRIADLDDHLFAIEMPLDETTGTFRKLEHNEPVTVTFSSEQGITHYFETEVIGKRKDQVPLYLLRMPRPQDISKVQRRSFFRVKANLDVACRKGNLLAFVAKTEDIGGGGISVSCDLDLPIREQDELSCWLLIHFRNGQIEHVPFRAKVLRTKPLEEKDRQLLMMQFTDISEAEQQKVVKFCFERELELRKKTADA